MKIIRKCAEIFEYNDGTHKTCQSDFVLINNNNKKVSTALKRSFGAQNLEPLPKVRPLP